MVADIGSGIREHNRRRVLDALGSTVALTRMDVVRLTGLSRATVTSIVGQLLADGTVRTVAPGVLAASQPRPGRKAELLALRPHSGHAFALDIAHESVRIALTGADGLIRHHVTTRIAASATPETTVGVVADVLEDFASTVGGDLRSAAGIVAAIPDPIDADGNVARPDPWSRWDGCNPARMLSERVGIEVRVENDANLAVIGEHLYGAARHMDDVIYVKIAHGVGTGIMTNGALVRGSNGLAGEVGHIQVRPDGHVCTCGNRGCLFTLVTGDYLGALLGDSRTGMEGFAAHAARNDAGAHRLLKDAGYEVGKVLANLANTLNPAGVFVGGRLAHIGESLLEGFRTAVDQFAEPQVARSLVIARTALKEGAELLGAAAVASGIRRETQRTQGAGLPISG